MIGRMPAIRGTMENPDRDEDSVLGTSGTICKLEAVEELSARFGSTLVGVTCEIWIDLHTL